MEQRYVVLADSAADLPFGWASDHKVAVLPAHVVVNNRSYRDDAALDRDWFHAQLATTTVRPTTAAPTPEEFRATYQRLLTNGTRGILGIMTASRLSSLYSNAVLGAAEMPSGTVRLIDSRQVSMATGLQVMSAVQALEQGCTLEDAASLVESLRERTLLLGALDSLEYLGRSGRVTLAAALVGGLLRIKPMFMIENGQVKVIGRARTFWRAVDHVVQRVRELIPLQWLVILHSRADVGVIEHLRDSLSFAAPTKPIPVLEVGPAFASHVGPGAIGVALIRRG